MSTELTCDQALSTLLGLVQAFATTHTDMRVAPGVYALWRDDLVQRGLLALSVLGYCPWGRSPEWQEWVKGGEAG